MKRTDIQAILQPLLARRLHALTDADLGNGTPLADAVASALAFDLATGRARVVRRAQIEVDALTRRQLLDAIDTVRTALAMGDNSYKGEMPLGSRIESTTNPGIALDRRQETAGRPRSFHATLQPLRGLPGLHERGTRGLESRPGAALLRDDIVRTLATLPACDVPPPATGDVRVETNWKWRDTLEVPIRGGPGATFIHSEHITQAETMLDIDIALRAAAVRELAASVIKASEKVDRAYRKTLGEIEATMDKAQAEGLPFRFNGVHIHSRHGTMTIDAQFAVLGNDLEPTTWIAPDYGAGLKQAVRNQLVVQRRRKRILDEAGAAGGRGRVDRITLNAIRALTDDPAALLRRIARERNVTIQAGRNGTRTDPVRLAWKDGRVESSFAITNKASWNYRRIIFRGVDLPEAVIMTLPGRPVSTLVEHPFLAGENTIRSVSGRPGKWLFANLDAEWTFFDAETGETIDVVPASGNADTTAQAPAQGDLLEEAA